MNNHGGLLVTHIDAVDLSSLGQELESDLVFLMRLGVQYLGESDRSACVEVNWVANEESNPDAGVVRALELVLEHRQRMFFDPMWTTGVRISNAGPRLGDCAQPVDVHPPHLDPAAYRHDPVIGRVGWQRAPEAADVLV